MRAASLARAEAAAWLARLKSDSLTEADRRACEAWLARSDTNRRALGEVTAAWEAAGALGRQEASTPLCGSPMLRRELVVGALACAAGAGVWTATAPTSYATGVGEIRRVALRDGSAATLDTDTLLKVRMTRTARRLHLVRGRLRLDAVQDPERPLTVSARNLQILAVGRALQVSARSNVESVAALDGALLVKTADEGAVQLLPGQQLVQGPARSAVLTDAPALARDTSWRFGQLVFDNEALASAAQEINRYNTRAVVVAPELAGLRISGVYRARDADGFADLVAALLGLRVVRGDGEVRLEPRARQQA